MTCLLCISVSPALSTESGVVIQSIIFGKKKKRNQCTNQSPRSGFSTACRQHSEKPRRALITRSNFEGVWESYWLWFYLGNGSAGPWTPGACLGVILEARLT